MRFVALSLLLCAGCLSRPSYLTAPIRFSTGPGTRTATAQASNGDGKADLIVTRAWLKGELSIRLGNGDGTFRPPTTMSCDAEPRGVAVADFNGDGKVDLAVGNMVSGGYVSVLIGRGDGT